MRTLEGMALIAEARSELDTPPWPSDPLAAMLPAGNPRYLKGERPTAELRRIDRTQRVLVLGPALAAADVVLALDAQGHRGTIKFVAPHGLLLSSQDRMAERAAERLAELRAASRLEVCAGSVRGADMHGETFVVDVLPRGRRICSSERYDWIVNCATDRCGRAS